MLGHVGDGNFHQMVMYNPQKEDERQAVKDCVDVMMRRALEMEGTVSVCLRLSFLIPCQVSLIYVTTDASRPKGEHGIGIGKKVSD